MAYSIDDSCISCSACARLCPVQAISLDEGLGRYVIDAVICIECGACGRVCPKASVLDPNGEKAVRVLRKDWKKPVIDLSKCISCQACTKVCFAGALTMDETIKTKWGKAPVLSDPKKCVDCGWCEDICPVDAIVLKTK